MDLGVNLAVRAFLIGRRRRRQVVSISQLLGILLRRVWIFMLTLLSTIITVVAALQFAPARYEAHATASIDPGSSGDPISTPRRIDVDLMQGNILSLVASQRVAMDAVKRLNLTNNPQIQQNLANSLLTNLDPKFDTGTNVLDITYKAPDPTQAALIANAFLAATIDASVAMKAAQADETARWFAPQLDELRKELEDARAALAAFQAKTNMVAPTQGGDRETSQYMAISDQLSNARAGLTALRSRLTNGSTDLSNDPQDPDLQILSGLKEKLTTAEAEIASSKGVLGANNPKMVAQQANIASVRKQIGEATEKMRQHLKERIDLAQSQIASLEGEQEQAQKSLIEVQAQRDRLSQLQRDVDFRAEQLNAREKAAEEAKLKSKLTFSDMTVLDKASPPVAPAFPKPLIVLPVGIAAGLALGLILALLTEAADRRVRFPVDLEYSASAPFLGALDGARRSRARVSASSRSLRPV
jgi:polysaccharide biosynthesis transport protein